MAAMSPDSHEPMDIDEERSLAEHDAVDAPSAVSEEEEEESEDDAPMVKTRARRSNAGKNMHLLIAKAAEEEEEEWGDEWGEVANEEDFVGGEVNEDEDNNLHSSSSSSEDDGGDEEAGEKELQKAERQDRVKKRKAAAPVNAFTASLAAARKRAKHKMPLSDPRPMPPPRPKKKSERASWIPTPEDGPIRMSARKQTVANKEITIAKLKEKDRRRDDTLAMMKAAEARKAKDEPKALTQAERLAEAARVEKMNSKSLHRWEEAEEQRAAERQAKLDALKNRQIEGPFIRYWSGPAIWVDDKIKYTGKDAPTVEALDEKLNKETVSAPEGGTSQTAGEKDSSVSEPINHVTGSSSQTLVYEPSVNDGWRAQQSHLQPSPAHPSQVLPAQVHPSQPQPMSTQTAQSRTSPSVATPQTIAVDPAQNRPTSSRDMQYPSTIMFPPPQGVNSFLSGIEHYASPQQPPHPDNSQQPSTPSLSPPATQPQQQNNFFGPTPTQSQTTHNHHFPPNPWSVPTAQSPFSQPHPSLSDPALINHTMNPQAPFQQLQHPLPLPLPPAPPRKKVIRKALRNLLILSSFPNLENPMVPRSRTSTSTRIREEDRLALIQLCSTLFSWDTAEATSFVSNMLNTKVSKGKKDAKDWVGKSRKEICAVTNKIARYRDPGTGISYHDQKAFSVLRGVVSGKFVWSGALGCYVGARPGVQGSQGGMAPVKGVPRRFVDIFAGPSIVSTQPCVGTQPAGGVASSGSTQAPGPGMPAMPAMPGPAPAGGVSETRDPSVSTIKIENVAGS